MAYISSVLLCSVLVQITNACHGGSLIRKYLCQINPRMRQRIGFRVNGIKLTVKNCDKKLIF